MPPARQQIDKATLDAFIREKRPEGGTYNIWHHRYSGQERDWSKKGAKAKFRCDPLKDSGTTAGSRNPNAYFCIYFAKGMCAQGASCSMWHRVPTVDDEVETTVDCFGRDKFSDFRQDMGGVGAFSTTNKTLYIGRITNVTEEAVRKHFEPWGKIARIHVLRHRGVAFVDYVSRASAEFAKEAMMSQSMDANETINVRWATETQLQKDRIFQDYVDDDPRLQALERKSETEVPEYYGEEQQQFESELPVEFATKKRTAEETGLDDIKRQKRLNEEDENDATEVNTYEYTPEQLQYYQDYYYHQQQPTATMTNTNSTQSSNTNNGIIPQNILQSLKQISGNKSLSSSNKTTITTSKSTVSKNGLGGLADYGSDSDSE
ncbi:uncharacterized protein BX664DRAFT_355511 [Halteromyces radiatus]|uniref:uncharacterized protein n=1 Tax=Halteromyces radiatus TaxID=101107 RepID=UPI002220D6F5|nr:uncharacterized protein BX664DRAFT_355511 [Halteromyces radiatus]KAI8100172.1 hypothetical protein BX664DRAFT_355511 [Halteromyces radiatus]